MIITRYVDVKGIIPDRRLPSKLTEEVIKRKTDLVKEVTSKSFLKNTSIIKTFTAFNEGQ